ncbi:MAG: GNAT family N-acetyltransferase [Oscillospiraceae bacterium]|nr:GNAT family N-acetyltransferase [Oscillospiraceae bacterium]
MGIICLTADDDRIYDALELAGRVFMQFEAPMFTAEGVDNFFRYINGKKLSDKLSEGSAVIYAYMDDEIIRSMLCICGGSHISLCFTDGEYQRKGMGSALLEAAFTENKSDCYTVNASPCGVNFYRRHGFVPTDMELMENGIIYTPMKKISERARY